MGLPYEPPVQWYQLQQSPRQRPQQFQSRATAIGEDAIGGAIIIAVWIFAGFTAGAVAVVLAPLVVPAVLGASAVWALLRLTGDKSHE